MKPTHIAVLATVAVVSLAACGGGGSNQPTTEPPPTDEESLPPPDTRPDVYPPLPFQVAALARQAPIVDLSGTLHVGADVAPPRASLASEPSVRGVTISSGTVTDGISRADMLAYLEHDAAAGTGGAYAHGYLARFGSVPPVVRVAEGTPPELIDVAVHAVQLINASLPHDWQLRFNAVPGPAGEDRITEGEILIEFAPNAVWPTRIRTLGSCLHGAGCADRRLTATPPYAATGGRVWIDPDQLPGIHLQSATIHELLHVLGRAHGESERFTSVMASSQLPGHMLFPVDREALLATYGWLTEGITRGEDLASSFGRWADTSLHIRGDIDDLEGAAFGVRYSHNGLSQPWAFGPTPHTNLADSGELSGTASWAGLLLGYGLESIVAGHADLSIELSTMQGILDFSNLRALTELGSETVVTWGDGDLSYSVRVRDNTFVQTGGDDGIVTGIFVGSRHEGMAGTLHRDDLAAAFGGSR